MKDLCKTGSVTVVQRFGAALNINPHFHSLFVDGYYYDTGEKLYFKGAVTPDSLELEKILKTVIKKSLRWLSRKGYIEGENLGEIAEQNPLSDIHGGSVSYKIAVGPRSGEKIQLVGFESQPSQKNSGGGVSIKGFNIHARVYIPGHQREKLKKLCRYILRGPLAKQRIKKAGNAKVSIQFKKQWSNGATHVVYSYLEFIEKLIALVPPARVNLVRYHGVFAPNSPWRSKIVPKLPEVEKAKVSKIYRIPWAELLKRTFGVDGERCKNCGGKLKAISVVKGEALAQTLLKSLGIPPSATKLKKASEKRGPPGSSVLYQDDYSQAPKGW